MHWLRPALLYLFMTVLLVAGIWLFWGEEISQKLQNAQPGTAKDRAKRSADTAKKKTPTKARLEQDEQTAVARKQAWEKVSSGFMLLLQAAAEENRRLLLESTAELDRRYQALFARPVEQRLPKSVEQRPLTPQAK